VDFVVSKPPSGPNKVLVTKSGYYLRETFTQALSNADGRRHPITPKKQNREEKRGKLKRLPIFSLRDECIHPLDI
jgi:hypothetical protein